MVTKKKSTSKPVAKPVPAPRSTMDSRPQRTRVPEDDIGERIKEAREALGWSQTVLHTRTKLADLNGEGISRTVLVGYESGKYKPGARELRILAETLRVTPSWLLYRADSPFGTELASMQFMHGKDEFEVAVRLALAILLLKRHERDLLAGLLFSLGGRALGDMRLSGLMVLANMLAGDFLTRLKQEYPDVFERKTVDEALPILMERMAEAGFESNYGNRFIFDRETGELVGGESLYPDPRKAST